MTNFTIEFYDGNHERIAVAHTTYFADAIHIARSLPNCDVIDSNTGEVLRIYKGGTKIYSV